MKIALLHLYANVPTGGEHTYGMHLQKGLHDLGHRCDIVVFSKSGKELKNYKNKGFRVCKESDKREIVREYDFIVLLSGILEDDPDYEFLRGLKVPMCAIEHSAWGTWKRYNFPKLFSIVGNIPVFGNSMTAVDIYKRKYLYDNCYAVRQPFAPEILFPAKAKEPSGTVRVIYPHRLSSNKKPEIIYDFFTNTVGNSVNYELQMYGTKTESIIRWSLLDELDQTETHNHGRVFRNKRVILNPVYLPIIELPHVYSQGDLTIHATRGKYDGGRMEYVLLESIFYNTPIMSDENQWLRNLDKNLIDEAWVEGKSYINMTVERLTQFANDIKFREDLLNSSKQIVEKFFNAKESAKKILDITLCNQIK